jgi:hypothetical protein
MSCSVEYASINAGSGHDDYRRKGQDLSRHKREQQDLERLITDKGLKRYGLFLVSGEGRRLPDGSDETSGYVVNQDRRVFYFWIAWDAERRRAAFTEWEEVEPEPDWADDSEYHEALAAAGIAHSPIKRRRRQAVRDG